MANVKTVSLCPINELTNVPLLRFQILIVVSTEPNWNVLFKDELPSYASTSSHVIMESLDGLNVVEFIEVKCEM